jgi:RNA polymerase sigma-70 factor (ECF subfamily)
VVTAILGEPEKAAREANLAGVLARIAGGEASALADLYDATSPLLFSLARRIVGEDGAAEDVVVEVYTQVWEQAGTYRRERGTPTGWLVMLARSRAIDWRRARARDGAGEPLESLGARSSDAPGPEDDAAQAERRRRVAAALADLDATQRHAIELAFFAGLSHSEIAARLGQPLGTVKTRIRAGMQRLRVALGDLAEGSGAPCCGGDHG